MRYRKSLLTLLLVLTAVFGLYGGCSSSGGSNIPADIRAIFNKAIYDDARSGVSALSTSTRAKCSSTSNRIIHSS